MLRHRTDQSLQNEAEFPQLPVSQTISFILSFLEEQLPSFSTFYQSSPISNLEDTISEKLFFFLQHKAKVSDLLIYFNLKKGVDFLVGVELFMLNAKPLFVIEAKRLSNKHYDYVQGRTGGIERFKREQEGFDQQLAVSAMLGYVQERDFAYWCHRINTWIQELIEQSDLSNNRIRWEQQDLLEEFSPSTAQMAHYISAHSRKTLKDIKLHHFWLNMVD